MADLHPAADLSALASSQALTRWRGSLSWSLAPPAYLSIRPSATAPRLSWWVGQALHACTRLSPAHAFRHRQRPVVDAAAASLPFFEVVFLQLPSAEDKKKDDDPLDDLVYGVFSFFPVLPACLSLAHVMLSPCSLIPSFSYPRARVRYAFLSALSFASAPSSPYPCARVRYAYVPSPSSAAPSPRPALLPAMRGALITLHHHVQSSITGDHVRAWVPQCGHRWLISLPLCCLACVLM